MPVLIPYLKVFLSSPGDVIQERQIALELMERLQYRPAFRDRVAFRFIAWDKLGAGTPMRATLTPQEAINRGLPKPSECDIVIVLFWSRMGTPFVHTDGVEYLSGTHWELLDALNADKPETLIYRRTEAPRFDAHDEKGIQQKRTLDTFMESELFYDADGRILRGVNHYETLDNFRQSFDTDFEDVVVRILQQIEAQPDAGITTAEDIPATSVVIIEAGDWNPERSPFPGLHPFTTADAPIFFGRERETDALVQQVAQNRFVAVIGDSGSGKSSLVAAGLIHRLHNGAIIAPQQNSEDWFIAQCTPGWRSEPEAPPNPFEALAKALMDNVPALGCDDPLDYPERLHRLTSMLAEQPNHLSQIVTASLKDEKPWTEVLLFFDQFEELFTVVDETYHEPFAQMLYSATHSDRIRLVITLRADFFHRVITLPHLPQLLQNGAFALALPRRDALRQMIEGPAYRARLQIEDGLIDKMLNDLGDEPGNLALLAYTLDELYHATRTNENRRIRLVDYHALGGIQGAIGTRAEAVFASLGDDHDHNHQILGRLFHRLVGVDERGVATRKRALIQPENLPADEQQMLTALVDARLLTTGSDGDLVMVQVAHEALLRKWERLVDWIADTHDDRRYIERFKREARIWRDRGKPDHMRPTAEELAEFHQALARFGETISDPLLLDFMEPEQNRLLAELENIETSHPRRFDIGERLARIGDPREGIGCDENGIPQFVWLPVTPSGEIKIGEETFPVRPFYIAKYLTTHAQFEAFTANAEIYRNPHWWRDFPEDYRPQTQRAAVNQNNNAPRDSVSWYQAVAFARWLTEEYRGTQLKHPAGDNHPDFIIGENCEIRLLAEWEWQWASQGGDLQREYPWDGGWDGKPRANTTEAGINDRSTAVGMYPHGVAKCGVMDMAGNLWEWCANKYDNPRGWAEDDSDARRTLRGGSFYDFRFNSRSAYRLKDHPSYQNRNIGFRLLVAPALSL